MISPAQRHRQHTLARLALESAAGAATAGLAGERPESGPAATEYELLLARLGADLARLRDIQSVEAKIALKAELIEAYDTHVDATLAAAADTGTALQDEIVARMLIWRLDIGDFSKALEIADHVLRFRLALPSNIVRDAATMVAEEIAEAALKVDRAGTAFPLETIDAVMRLTDPHDMPDQVRAKLFKARGRHLGRMAETLKDSATAPAGGIAAAQREALLAFNRALGLDRNCGVKKDIERLASAVRAQACAPAPGDGEGSGEGAGPTSAS